MIVMGSSQHIPCKDKLVLQLGSVGQGWQLGPPQKLGLEQKLVTEHS